MSFLLLHALLQFKFSLQTFENHKELSLDDTNQQNVIKKNYLFYNEKQEIEPLKRYIRDVNFCKELFPAYIFNFSHKLYKKIWDCQNGKFLQFKKDEIKQILSFGLTVYEGNERLTKNIYFRLINGLYVQIINEYFIVLRNSLIKNFIKFIIYFEFNLFFNDSLSNKTDFINFENEYITKKVLEFSNVIYEEENIQIINTIITEIFDNIFNKSIKNENYYNSEGIENALQINKLINEKIEIIIKIIKVFDQNIYFSSEKQTEMLNHIQIQKVIDFLATKTAPYINIELFQKENYKVFFSIDILHNFFFKNCSNNYSLHIENKYGNIIKFNRNCGFSEIYDLYFDFENISFIDAFNSYTAPIVCISQNYLETEYNFLQFILKLEGLIFDIKKSFILKFEKDNIIDYEYLQNFFDFLEYFKKNDCSICIDSYKKKYKNIEHTTLEFSDLLKSVNLLFIRYILRKSFLEYKLKDEKKNNLYVKMYELITPKLDKNFEFFVPLFDVNSIKVSVDQKILHAIQFYIDSDNSNNRSEVFFFECDKCSIKLNISEISSEIKTVLIAGEIESFETEEYLNIFGFFVDNFCHLIITNSDITHFENNVVDFQFTDNNSLFLKKRIHISTKSIIFLIFYKFMKVQNRYDYDFSEKLVILYKCAFYCLNVKFELLKIPQNIHSLHFKNSICSVSDLNILNRFFIKCILETLIFENCILTTPLEIYGNIKKIKFEICKFNFNLFITKECEFKSLNFYNCSGKIYFDKFILEQKGHSNKSQFNIVKSSYCTIDKFNLTGILNFNINVKLITIKNSSLNISISINFSNFVISRCFGNFKIFLEYFSYDMGKLVILSISHFEIIINEDIFIFILKNIYFYKNQTSFFKSSEKIKVKIDKCYHFVNNKMVKIVI